MGIGDFSTGKDSSTDDPSATYPALCERGHSKMDSGLSDEEEVTVEEAYHYLKRGGLVRLVLKDQGDGSLQLGYARLVLGIADAAENDEWERLMKYLEPPAEVAEEYAEWKRSEDEE